MKRYYSLITKFLCLCLVALFSSFYIVPHGTAQAWIYPDWKKHYKLPPLPSNNRYYHSSYHRHHHDDSIDTTGAVVLGGILIGALINANNHSNSNQTYSDKYGKIINNFDQEETKIFNTISQVTPGTTQGIQYWGDEDLKKVKKVIDKLYGEFIYLGTMHSSGSDLVVFYRFTEIYESEKITGMEYYDFASLNFLSQLSTGIHKIPYNEKFATKLATNLKKAFWNARCYRDGEFLVIYNN